MPTAQPPLTLSEIAAIYWPVFVAALLVSLIATPICRKVALRYRIVDRPDDWLKPHATPIPYLGGVAVFLGWVVGVVIGLVRVDHPPLLHMGAILLAGLGVTATGLFDDLRVMRPATKLVCSLIVAAVVIVGAGIGDDLIRMFIRLTRVYLEEPLVVAFSLPLSLFIIVGACNATNLIDGLDGLCSGVLSIISIGFLVLAVHLAVYPSHKPLHPERITLALAMAGAALGFLPFNRNPARIFLGDAGSMLLGLNAAVLILLFGEAGCLRWMLGAVMVFGLPVFDMLLTLARRWRNNRPLMQGDRSHFYDQLIDRGYSVRQVVAISYGLALFFVILGCATMFVRTRFVILIYMLVVLLVALIVLKLGMVRVDAPPAPSSAGDSSDDT